MKKGLIKDVTGIAARMVASGIFVCLFSQSSLAQLGDGTPTPADLQRQREMMRAIEQGNFEMKGEELRVCSSDGNSDKKNCNTVATGYAPVLALANQLFSQGNLASAESMFRELTRSHPKEATPYYKLGIILDRQGRTDEAVSQYRRAIEINAKHALARNSLGVALARQGNLNDAISEWQEALKINPEYADALTNLGIALLQQNKEAEAIESLKKAKELFMKQNEFAKAKQIDQILQEINSRAT